MFYVLLGYAPCILAIKSSFFLYMTEFPKKKKEGCSYFGRVGKDGGLVSREEARNPVWEEK